jgi:hypothetical protein
MASSIDIAVPQIGNPTTADVRANFGYAKSEIEALQDRRTNSGQIKANYGTSLQVIGYTANVAKQVNIIAATASLSSSPTTTFPASAPSNTYADIFDATRGSTPVAGRLIENPIPGQVHFWRVQGNYANKALAQVGALNLVLRNPVSSFFYEFHIALADGVTGDDFNALFITIADGASIPSPNGYILETAANFTDVDLTTTITSITRISMPAEITTPVV